MSVTPNTEPLHQLGTTAFAARHTDATTVHTPSTLVKAQTSCSLHLFQFNCLIPVLSDTIWWKIKLKSVVIWHLRFQNVVVAIDILNTICWLFYVFFLKHLTIVLLVTEWNILGIRNKILYLTYRIDVQDWAINPPQTEVNFPGVFWCLTHVWACTSHSRCPLLDEITFPSSRHAVTHQSDVLVSAFLICVILGALPVVISAVKNDVFILANKRISRVATPTHYGWSSVWSPTIRWHLPWQGEDCVQFTQSTAATFERSKCVTFFSLTWQFSISPKVTFQM